MKDKAVTARGVEGKVDGCHVRVGSQRLFDEAGIELGDLDERLVQFETSGKTAMLVSRS